MMSYQVKRTIVVGFTNILLLAAYCIRVFGKSGQELRFSGEFKDWAITILIFIGIGVVLNILIQIVFHIFISIGIAIKTKIEDESISDEDIEKNIRSEIGAGDDEMDKLIDLKAGRAGQIFAGAGAIISIIYAAIGYPAFVMLNIMFISFALSAVIENVLKVYFYRKGVRNG